MRRTVALEMLVIGLLAIGACSAVSCCQRDKGTGEQDDTYSEDPMEGLRALEKHVEQETKARMQAFDMRQAAEAVAQIRGGALHVEPDGTVALPPSLARLTWDGRVYVTPGRNRSVAYLFPVVVFKGANLLGYLYLVGALSDLETWQDAGTDEPGLTCVLPLRGGAPRRGDIVILRREPGNWFLVSRTID